MCAKSVRNQAGGGRGIKRPGISKNPGISASTGTGRYNALDDFYTANNDRINGLANTNKVDTATAKAMLNSNIMGTGKYQGAGVGNMGALRTAYESALGQAGSHNYNSQQSYSPSQDYYGDIRSALENQYAQQQKAIQEGVNNAVSQNEAYIPQVNKSFEDSVRSAYVSREQNKAQLPEAMSSMGMTGGAAESALLGVNTGFENTRNQSQRAKEEALNQISQNSANIRSSGNTSLATLGADFQGQLVQALQNAQQMSQSDKQWQAQYDMSKQGMDRDLFATTLSGYYDNFQSEINRRISQGADPNSYEILMLKAARQNKIGSQATAEAEARQQEFDNAIKLGQYNYQTSKPYYNPNSGRGSKGKGYVGQSNGGSGYQPLSVKSSKEPTSYSPSLAMPADPNRKTNTNSDVTKIAQMYEQGKINLATLKTSLKKYGYGTDGATMWITD